MFGYLLEVGQGVPGSLCPCKCRKQRNGLYREVQAPRLRTGSRRQDDALCERMPGRGRRALVLEDEGPWSGATPCAGRATLAGSQGMASQFDESVAMRGLWAAAEKADQKPRGVALRTASNSGSRSRECLGVLIRPAPYSFFEVTPVTGQGRAAAVAWPKKRKVWPKSEGCAFAGQAKKD